MVNATVVGLILTWWKSMVTKRSVVLSFASQHSIFPKYVKWKVGNGVTYHWITSVYAAISGMQLWEAKKSNRFFYELTLTNSNTKSTTKINSTFHNLTLKPTPSSTTHAGIPCIHIGYLSQVVYSLSVYVCPGGLTRIVSQRI